MKYEKIINLEHFHANGKKYMSMHDRAGQFAPYKALDGHEDMIMTETWEKNNQVWEDVDYFDRQDSLEF